MAPEANAVSLANKQRGPAAVAGIRTQVSRVSIVIPTYNEERTVAALIRRVQQAPLDGLEKEIIVVDDGSADRTVEQLRQFGDQIRLIRHTRNRGKGAAVRTGFDAATGQVLLIQDADLEYDPNDFPAVVAPLVEGRADAVLGSRFILERPRFFLRQDGSPFFSHYIGNKLIIWLTNWLYGVRATDYEGCYKAFTAEAIRATPVQADGFEFDNELVCKLLRRRARIVEVPIRYHPRVYGDGKKIRWQHGVRMLWTILKWRIWPL